MCVRPASTQTHRLNGTGFAQRPSRVSPTCGTALAAARWWTCIATPTEVAKGQRRRAVRQNKTHGKGMGPRPNHSAKHTKKKKTATRDGRSDKIFQEFKEKGVHQTGRWGREVTGLVESCGSTLEVVVGSSNEDTRTPSPHI